MKPFSRTVTSIWCVGHFFAILAFLCFTAAICDATPRVALVIGKNQYQNLSPRMQLTSPVADATDVAAALKSLGYTLITGGALTDASSDSITLATEQFAAAARNAEAAVFYFFGHGVQLGDDNCIIPLIHLCSSAPPC